MKKLFILALTDIQSFYRIIGLYILLHIVLFFVELYRYKHSTMSWYRYKNNGALEITYVLLGIDLFAILIGIMIWAMEPLINR